MRPKQKIVAHRRSADDNTTLLHVAASKGDDRLVELLLKQNGIITNNANYQVALVNGHAEVVGKFLNLDPHFKDNKNLKPLVRDSIRYGRLNILKLLESRGVSVSESMPEWQSILHAAEHGQVDILVYLIKVALNFLYLTVVQLP